MDSGASKSQAAWHANGEALSQSLNGGSGSVSSSAAALDRAQMAGSAGEFGSAAEDVASLSSLHARSDRHASDHDRPPNPGSVGGGSGSLGPATSTGSHADIASGAALRPPQAHGGSSTSRGSSVAAKKQIMRTVIVPLSLDIRSGSTALMSGGPTYTRALNASLAFRLRKYTPLYMPSIPPGESADDIVSLTDQSLLSESVQCHESAASAGAIPSAGQQHGESFIPASQTAYQHHQLLPHGHAGHGHAQPHHPLANVAHYHHRTPQTQSPSLPPPSAAHRRQAGDDRVQTPHAALAMAPMPPNIPPPPVIKKKTRRPGINALNVVGHGRGQPAVPHLPPKTAPDSTTPASNRSLPIQVPRADRPAADAPPVYSEGDAGSVVREDSVPLFILAGAVIGDGGMVAMTTSPTSMSTASNTPRHSNDGSERFSGHQQQQQQQQQQSGPVHGESLADAVARASTRLEVRASVTRARSGHGRTPTMPAGGGGESGRDAGTPLPLAETGTDDASPTPQAAPIHDDETRQVVSPGGGDGWSVHQFGGPTCTPAPEASGTEGGLHPGGSEDENGLSVSTTALRHRQQKLKELDMQDRISKQQAKDILKSTITFTKREHLQRTDLVHRKRDPVSKYSDLVSTLKWGPSFASPPKTAGYVCPSRPPAALKPMLSKIFGPHASRLDPSDVGADPQFVEVSARTVLPAGVHLMPNPRVVQVHRDPITRNMAIPLGPTMWHDVLRVANASVPSADKVLEGFAGTALGFTVKGGKGDVAPASEPWLSPMELYSLGPHREAIQRAIEAVDRASRRKRSAGSSASHRRRKSGIDVDAPVSSGNVAATPPADLPTRGMTVYASAESVSALDAPQPSLSVPQSATQSTPSLPASQPQDAVQSTDAIDTSLEDANNGASSAPQTRPQTSQTRASTSFSLLTPPTPTSPTTQTLASASASASKRRRNLSVNLTQFEWPASCTVDRQRRIIQHFSTLYAQHKAAVHPKTLPSSHPSSLAASGTHKSRPVSAVSMPSVSLAAEAESLSQPQPPAQHQEGTPGQGARAARRLKAVPTPGLINGKRAPPALRKQYVEVVADPEIGLFRSSMLASPDVDDAKHMHAHAHNPSPPPALIPTTSYLTGSAHDVQ
ncbi:hypothetical protein BC831DRAFT_549321 [Entophlyctis helioformis]|nr:hypothetical protein BC831DRAFT_549321 [Entophlyctis helioformis]